MIDKLHNMGVVRPARVDESGRPVAVEHVLQLVEDQGKLLIHSVRHKVNQDHFLDHALDQDCVRHVFLIRIKYLSMFIKSLIMVKY